MSYIFIIKYVSRVIESYVFLMNRPISCFLPGRFVASATMATVFVDGGQCRVPNMNNNVDNIVNVIEPF